MTFEIVVLDQGFLLPPTPSLPADGRDPFAVVVPGLTVGVAYTRVRAEHEQYVVVFSFDADEERAVAAAIPAIAERFPDAKVAHAIGVSLRDGVLRKRVVTSGGARMAVAAVSASASLNTVPSRVIAEVGDATYVARPVAMNGGYRVDVEQGTKDEEPVPPEAVARGPAADAVATLERVTAKLRGRFADPEGAALYRAALRDLGIAYRRAGQADKATAALQLCASLFELVLMPTEQDRALRKRVELELRGADPLELDLRRWQELDRDDG